MEADSALQTPVSTLLLLLARQLQNSRSAMCGVADLTLSWCLGILAPGMLDHSGSGRGSESPAGGGGPAFVGEVQRRPHSAGRPPYSAFCVCCGQLSVWNAVCSCPGDGRSVGAVCRVPGPGSVTAGLCISPGPSLTHCICPQLRGLIWEGIRKPTCCVLQENVFAANVCVVGMAWQGCPGPAVTQAERHQRGAEKVQGQSQGEAGGVWPGLAEVEVQHPDLGDWGQKGHLHPEGGPLTAALKGGLALGVHTAPHRLYLLSWAPGGRVAVGRSLGVEVLVMTDVLAAVATLTLQGLAPYPVQTVASRQGPGVAWTGAFLLEAVSFWAC